MCGEHARASPGGKRRERASALHDASVLDQRGAKPIARLHGEILHPAKTKFAGFRMTILVGSSIYGVDVFGDEELEDAIA